MKKTNLIWAAAAALILAGCSSANDNSQAANDADVSETSISETSVSNESASEDAQESGEKVMIKVTSCNSGTVTGNKMGGMGEPPKMKGEEPPAGDKPDNGSGDNPPEMNGDKPEGEPPTGGNKPDSAPQMGEEVSYSVGDIDVSGISEGDMVKIVLDERGNVISITKEEIPQPGQPGGGFGANGTDNGTAANNADDNAVLSNMSYSSENDDENALRADGVTVSLTDCTITKTGSSSNTENGDFYGMNAALLAENGAQVTVIGGEVSTSATNGNGIFSYGSGTVVNVSGTKICTAERNSGGIQTTGGGTMNAEDLDVQTEGNSSAAIRSDRGGGTVNVKGGTYVTNGTGSPAIYSTADISVSDAVLTANNSEGIVVEGKNSVKLTDCTLSGKMQGTYNDDSENIRCIMIYQSMSGDADVGEAYFEANGGEITSLAGDMFYVTNTSCEIKLSGVKFNMSDGVFLRVVGNSSSRSWGKRGENGGDVKMSLTDQTVEGDIVVDEISTLDLDMSGSVLTGAINDDNSGGNISVSLDENSTWNLTSDCYISSFDGDISNINAGEFHFYVNGEMVV
ncbi:hypothetical protein [Huintestinicola butyrica]|uniref:hypothetical protein n=1 Tax=Huintestinicola butyrica TaxID=2981728 RepID=UPI003F7F3E44